MFIDAYVWSVNVSVKAHMDDDFIMESYSLWVE